MKKKTVLTTGQFTQCLALNKTPGGGGHLNTLCLSGRIGKVVEGSRVWHMCVKVSERLSPISFTELRESNPKSPFLYS